MYPDWPLSSADLVPLPQCEGPKLQPFEFGGPQKIEYLDHLGEGLHAHVFKVQILGRIYALKVFRFVYDDDWLGPAEHTDPNDRKAMSAFYNYSEPFSAEYRAFGRLREAGWEELAIRCFGYVLLDEEYERVLMHQFSHKGFDFNGNGDAPGAEDMRSRFLGRNGRVPPLRGIVKEFGPVGEALRAGSARSLLRDIIRLQQLGIIHLDVAHRQLICSKLVDFSTAITIPHFITTPELNPVLGPEWISAIEFESFQFSINDYWSFDSMVQLWNEEHEGRQDQISVWVFPSKKGRQIRNNRQPRYNFRSTLSCKRVSTLVDPRQYDWRVSSRESSNRRTNLGAKTKPWSRLYAKPPAWNYYCDSKQASMFKTAIMFSTSLEWEFKDGLIFPRKKQ